MDNLDWDTEDYKTENGHSPLESFLDSLPSKVSDKILRDIELLERFGPRWGQPHVDYFRKEDIYELRIKHSSNIYRVFFFRWKGTLLLLTHGFVKKSQKTPKGELNHAIRLRDDWLSRKGD